MCGIIGFLDKRGEQERPLGATLLSMLEALSCRGPDSAGVALFGPRQAGWILQVKLPEGADADSSVRGILGVLKEKGMVVRQDAVGAYLRLELASGEEAAVLETDLLARVPGA